MSSGPAIGQASEESTPPLVAGRALFDGYLVSVPLPVVVAQELVPPQVELDQERVLDGTYPVVLVMGQQKHGSIVRAGVPIPVGSNYSEFGLFVPDVLWRGSGLRFNYVAQMYSGYFPAVFVGNVDYGYAKHFGDIVREDDRLFLNSENGELLFHAYFDGNAPWRRWRAESEPTMDFIQSSLSQPMLGLRLSGQWVYSFNWWNLDRALFRRVGATLSVDQPLVRGFGPLTASVPRGGAFEVKSMLWELSWPRFPASDWDSPTTTSLGRRQR